MERSYQSRIAAIAEENCSEHVFGAVSGRQGHRFQLNRHSIREIAEFEEQLGVQLPEDYVQLLVETGSGAGPYYGLLSPTEVLAEIRDLNEVRKEVSSEVLRPIALFPFRQSDADELCLHQPTERKPKGGTTWIADGYIPICNHGCMLSDVLVTSGEVVGTVWSFNYEPTSVRWWPAGRPPGLRRGFKVRPLPSPPMPPTVRQWYESWLERVEIDLNDYRILRHGSLWWRISDSFKYQMKALLASFEPRRRHGKS